MSEGQITVGVDVGSHLHRVAIGTPEEKIAEEFDLPHDRDGFEKFFGRITHYEKTYRVPVVVAMEGFNGYARPLDRMVQKKGYRLLNVNNLKLRRFKEIFPSPAKTDVIDARKILELVRLQPLLTDQEVILQEVREVPKEHQVLKRLTRRRRQLVREKASLMNRMQSDLHAVSPELADLAKNKDGLAFLRFLTCREDLRQLERVQKRTLLGIKGIGEVFAGKVKEWQKKAQFSEEAEYAGPMIIEDGRRILELKERIKALDKQIGELCERSDLAGIVRSIPGFGLTCTSEIVAEIGSMDRFRSEGSLAMYLGMAPLDNSSGKRRGTSHAKQVNIRARSAMMTAMNRHILRVEESERYYRKKRNEGKRHNQAIRSLGRHMVRVMWSMTRDGHFYENREKNNMVEVVKEVVLISLCKPPLSGRIDISQDDGGLYYGEEREEGQRQVA